MGRGRQSGTRWLPGAVVLPTVLALTGCGPSGPGDEAGGPEPVVAVGSQWYGHVPVWVGIQRGTFADHGFQVSWRFIGKSMDRLNAISSGDAQFASLGEIAMLSAMAQGNRRFYWVGNQDIAPGFEGLVARPGIRSYQDLRGRRIGLPFGSSVEVTCRLLLRDHGLDPDRDVELVNLEVGDVPAVFRAGNVDAALVWEPGFSQLKAVEGATLLGSDTDTVFYRRFGTMTGPDVLVLAREWVDGDPARARRFMTAYFDALDWTARHPDQAADLVHGTYIQQHPQTIRDHLRRFVWQSADQQARVMTDDGIFGQAEYLLDLLHGEMGALPRRPPFREWVNLEVLPAPATRPTTRQAG